MDYNFNTPTGWQCPVCSYVYNMGVVGCLNCNRPHHEKFKFTTTTTETPKNEEVILDEIVKIENDVNTRADNVKAKHEQIEKTHAELKSAKPTN